MPQRRGPSGPSAEALGLAALLQTPVTNTGDWMARNEQLGRAQADYKRQRQSVGDSLNNAFYDAFRGEARNRIAAADRSGNTKDREHISYLINNLIANNGSLATVPGATFQMPTGDQQSNYLRQMAANGANIGDAAYQMAADNDYLFGIGRDGLYGSGSLNGFMQNPIGYRSMGIEGRTPFKTYQDIDAVDNIAYGGDGSQAAIALQQEQMRQFRWNQDAINRYNQSMANKNPMGRFIGGQVQRGPGLPGVDANGWIPDWVPDGKYNPAQLSNAIKSYGKTQGYLSGRGVTQMGDPTKSTGEAPAGSWQSVPRGGAGGSVKGSSGFPDAGWIDTPGDNWRWDKGDQQWTQDGLPEPVDPVNSQWINNLNYRGRSEAERNQNLGSVKSFGALPAMMGMAEAPKLVQRSAPTSPSRSAKPFSAQDFSAGALSPSRGFGGTTLDPYYMGDYQQLFNKNFGTSWDYQRANDGGFGRWQTNPFSAGRVNAAMGGF